MRGCCQQSRAAGAQETDDPTLYILKTKLSVKRSQPQPQRTPFLNAKPPPKIKIKKANELFSLFLLSGGFTLGAGDAPPGLSGRGRSLVRGPPGWAGNPATVGLPGIRQVWGQQATKQVKRHSACTRTCPNLNSCPPELDPTPASPDCQDQPDLPFA